MHDTTVVTEANERLQLKREIRRLLAPYARPSYALGVGLFLLDSALYLVAFAGTLLAESIGLKIASAILSGLAIARLFVLGHDAMHQSLTPSHAANKLMAAIALLPSYTCASLWRAGHNVAHHGFPGLRGRDIPWVPLSPREYQELGPLQRRVYGIYRSPWGAWAYYGVEIWWKLLIFPRGKRRSEFTRQSIMVTLFLLTQSSIAIACAVITDQSSLLLLLLAVILPFIVWLNLAAFVFFVHHTDESSKWFDDERSWRRAQPDLENIHHVSLPLGIHRLFHNALVHTAHHLNPSIPSYRLPAAQLSLERAYGHRIVAQHLSFKRYADIMSRCQVYDYSNHTWHSITDLPSVSATAWSSTTRPARTQ
mgnify:CR=1 FL=1